jgi:preprotein translocase subunit SecY
MLLCVTVFRIAAHIPVPGIDSSGLESLLAGNQFLGLLNVFSGGTLKSFSIVALGVGPYITSSIIFQLLGMIFPSIEEMQKEEQGRQKINRWTRFATVPLSFLQGYSILKLLQQSSASLGVQISFSTMDYIVALVSMTAGTILLMWLGELISERKMGNGLSIMIFSGIIASMPSFLAKSLAATTGADTMNILLYVGLTLVTIVGVVYVTEGQRNLPVQYARGGGAGQSGSSVMSSLPLRINMGGMIPILFALSLIVLPPLVAQFFTSARTELVREVATRTISLFGNNYFYGLVYFILVFAFTFFYSSVVFKPEQVAENLQKQGGFIPGVRPGEQTTKYLQWVTNRLLILGALFLGIIAVLPVIMQEVTGTQNLVVGGSSVIIVVSVIVDMAKQIEAQLTMRSYETK